MDLNINISSYVYFLSVNWIGSEVVLNSRGDIRALYCSCFVNFTVIIFDLWLVIEEIVANISEVVFFFGLIHIWSSIIVDSGKFYGDIITEADIAGCLQQ